MFTQSSKRYPESLLFRRQFSFQLLDLHHLIVELEVRFGLGFIRLVVFVGALTLVKGDERLLLIAYASSEYDVQYLL